MSDLVQLQTIQANLLTAIEQLSMDVIQAYSLEGRTITKANIGELWKAYRDAKAEAGIEQAKTVVGGRRNYASLGRLTQ